MGDIHSVEVGDRFESIGTETTFEVVKIWFDFSPADNRWETSVIWDVRHPFHGHDQISAKGRDFVKVLQEGDFVRVNKLEESSSNGSTAAPSSSTDTIDPKQKKWEDDFRQNATRYGLSPSDLGRRVTLSRNKPGHFMIIGAKPRNWKMPILLKGKRGGIYKITAERAKAGLM